MWAFPTITANRWNKPLIVIKIAVAFILCLIAAKILSFKKLLILFTVFLGYSFAFAHFNDSSITITG